MDYQIDTSQRIVTITGDYAEPSEWARLLATVLADPSYRRGSSFVRDLRGSRNPVTAQSVMGIIAVVREYWDRLQVHRAAIVTPHGVDVPAVVAEALAAQERFPLRAFTSHDDAMAWVLADRAPE